MIGAGPVSLREIGRVKSAAARVALLPVADLAGYTANTAFWLARAAVNLEVAAARARLHADRPVAPAAGMRGGRHRDSRPRRGASLAGQGVSRGSWPSRAVAGGMDRKAEEEPIVELPAIPGPPAKTRQRFRRG
jgi:hypothetical protein